MVTIKAVSETVEAMVADRGVNESGELPMGWASEIAAQLDVPCDEQLVSWAEQAYARIASA